jgi:hypothetical protein
MKRCGTICSWDFNRESDMPELQICQCKECDLPVLALGMCNKHWRRNKKYGSPFITKYHMLRGLPADRRFSKLHKKMDSGCWEWIGPLDQDGYGVFNASFNDTNYHRAHRFSWAFHNLSDIPNGKMVCHACDNTRCVNPDHLWLGEAIENNGDRARKGRNHIQNGELGNKAVLTEAQVREILIDARPYSEIAHAYGVAASTIGSIKNRVSWSHLEVDHIHKNPRGDGGISRRGKSDRITPEIVRIIRASAEQGKLLAERFQVSPQMITAIRKRRCWAHVE